MVDYAPTKTVIEGQNAKYMSALSITLASMPVRENVVFLVDANAKTWKRKTRGGERDSEVLDAYSRDVLKEKWQTIAVLRGRQKSRFSEHVLL